MAGNVHFIEGLDSQDTGTSSEVKGVFLWHGAVLPLVVIILISDDRPERSNSLIQPPLRLRLGRLR